MNFDEFLNELHIDRELIQIRFSGMDHILERFLLRFPGDQSMDLMKQAISKNQTEEFERAAHTLKGLAANLGLDELSRLSADCVQLIRSNHIEAAKQQYPYILAEYNRIIFIINHYSSRK